MKYAKGFFDLQVAFAETVSALSGLPLAHAALAYTNLYIRFGLGRDFDPADARWRASLAGLLESDDRRGWTYRFYVERSPVVTPPGLVATFGCFSLPLWGQFVNRHGGVRENEARLFRERLARQPNLECLDQCVPFAVLGLEAPLDDFSRHYGV